MRHLLVTADRAFVCGRLPEDAVPRGLGLPCDGARPGGARGAEARLWSAQPAARARV